jgi:hypothetical protein
VAGDVLQLSVRREATSRRAPAAAMPQAARGVSAAAAAASVYSEVSGPRPWPRTAARPAQGGPKGSRDPMRRAPPRFVTPTPSSVSGLGRWPP